MPSDKQLTQISKLLSLVLRHQPEKIGLNLDAEGWADASELLLKLNEFGIKIDRELLDFLVETNAKKRFAWNVTKDKIRASQGHSIEVSLGYIPQTPPDILYHGTSLAFVDSIMQQGLQKQSRQHVHLSSDKETAYKVGQRHGKPVVLTILAGNMQTDQFEFFLSENQVWLTEEVPPNYILPTERTEN